MVVSNTGGFTSGFNVTTPPTQYVNGVQVHASPWDLGLDFQLLTPAGLDADGNAQVSVQIVARIVMSPQHGKAFAAILQTLLSSWEKQYGPLPETTDLAGVTITEEQSP